MIKKAAAVVGALMMLSLFGCGGMGREVNELRFKSGNASEYVNWIGRCYYYDTAEKVSFSNSSSGFEVGFFGTELRAEIISTGSQEIGEAIGNAYIYVFIDGETDYTKARKIELNDEETATEYILAQNLAKGGHTVRVLKCTEVKYGTAYLTGLSCDGSFLKHKPADRLKFELIGDSITCGYEAMVEGGEDTRRTAMENSLASYGYVAASGLGARVHTVCRSGALLSGYNSLPSIPDYYGLYSAADRAPWDFGQYIPDAVIIDLGTNDNGQQVPESLFKQKYSEFIKFIRSKYAQAAIVCCSGAVTNALDEITEEIVNAEKAAGDERVYYFRLPVRAASGHPRVREHRDNGEALAEFIYENLSFAKG